MPTIKDLCRRRKRFGFGGSVTVCVGCGSDGVGLCVYCLEGGGGRKAPDLQEVAEDNKARQIERDHI